MFPHFSEMVISPNRVLISIILIRLACLLSSSPLYQQHQKYREEIKKLITKDHLSFQQLQELLSLTISEKGNKRGGRSKIIMNESR